MGSNDKKTQNLLTQMMKAYRVYKKTGNKSAFTAVEDQLDAFADELFLEDLRKEVDRDVRKLFEKMIHNSKRKRGSSRND